MPGTRPARYRRGGSATPAPSDPYDIGQARVLGFFLDLTTKLSGETMFAAEAAKLHARSPAKPTQFFRPTTWRERKLAELRTPEVARKWRFRMNMPMDSFVSTFAKGAQ